MVALEKLQLYYGLAIRRHHGNLEAMRNAVRTTFIHKASTDENSNSLCESGPDSWCGLKNAVAKGDVPFI